MDYPPQWDADVVLSDGATMHVRPVVPDDVALIKAFHARQSAESIYYRYFSPRPTLSDKDLGHLTNVDYVDRMAFVALLGDDLIGIARYDRYPTAGKAEVAFFTDDAHQGRGISTVLLEFLAAAARHVGISGFVAQVLPQNRKMLSVFKQAGFEVHSRFEDGVIEVELDIAPTDEARAVIEERARSAFARSVKRLLAPGSIAVIGASQRPDAVGHQMLRRLIDGGFQGPVFPVNSTSQFVSSVLAYSSVLDIPVPVDLAIVCVPASEVRGIVVECARKHVQGLVVVSAGFSESGPDGAELERDIVELAHRHGMRIVGPNSMGVVNTSPDVSLQATFVGRAALAGNIGVSSQSGTLGAAIIGYARRLGLGISTFVSLGNKADVSSNDLLQYWEDDDDTALALLHLDSFGNPHNFARIIRRLTRHKPVVAVKSGRSVRLAENADGLPVDASLDSLLAETGVIRVDTLEQLFDVALVLSRQPVPSGRRLAVLSNSWGPATLAADAAVGAGLELAELSVPDHPGNPIDLGYAAGAAEFSRALSIILANADVDAVLVLCTPPVFSDLDDIATAIREVAKDSSIPVVTSYLGLTRGSEDPRSREIPTFEFPESAVYALGRIARYGEWLARDPGTLPDVDLVDADALRDIVDLLLEDVDSGAWQKMDVSASIANAAGLRVVGCRLVADGATGIAAAEEVGWPVAIKATGITRPAKTEAGGVAVDIHDADELLRAYNRMADSLGEAMHPAMIQAMSPPGVDVRVTMHRNREVGTVVALSVDHTFRPVVTGIELHVVPFSDADAHRLVEASGLVGVLESAAAAAGRVDEGSTAASVGHLVDLLLRLSVLSEVIPELSSVVLDPVLVSENGAWVTDVRVKLAEPEQRSGLDVRRLQPETES